MARILNSKIQMNDSEFKKLLSSILDLPYAKSRQLIQKVRSEEVEKKKLVLPASISLGKKLR